jgi:hypothetical protein
MRVRELRTSRVITEILENSAGAAPAIAGLNATIAELNYAADLSAQNVMAPAAGFLGTGTVYKSAVTREGDFIRTMIYINLTGAKSTTTDLDIIGVSGASPIGQITAAVNGTIIAGKMECLLVPTTGVTDIDLYSATVGTGAYDADASGLTGAAAVITSGGAWTLALTKAFGTIPAANTYLYLAAGAAGTPATYGSGKFIITLWGV